MYSSGVLNGWLIFYELFCEGPDLRKYALMSVRGLMGIMNSYCMALAILSNLNQCNKDIIVLVNITIIYIGIVCAV